MARDHVSFIKSKVNVAGITEAGADLKTEILKEVEIEDPQDAEEIIQTNAKKAKNNTDMSRSKKKEINGEKAIVENSTKTDTTSQSRA